MIDQRIDDTTGLERLMFYLQQPPTLEERAEHFTEEVEDITDLQEKVRIEAERDLFGWLGIGHSAEPTESSTATAAAYGDLDIAEWNAQHADWLDEKRTQEDARY